MTSCAVSVVCRCYIMTCIRRLPTTSNRLRSEIGSTILSSPQGMCPFCNMRTRRSPWWTMTRDEYHCYFFIWCTRIRFCNAKIKELLRDSVCSTPHIIVTKALYWLHFDHCQAHAILYFRRDRGILFPVHQLRLHHSSDILSNDCLLLRLWTVDHHRFHLDKKEAWLYCGSWTRISKE